jgi:hypothetical protein
MSLYQAELDPKKLERESAQKPVDNEKLMEKQHPRQIIGSETPNNNAIDPSFKKKLD